MKRATGLAEIATELTRDRFHHGRFEAYQPVSGHRAGSDALLLAASLPAVASGNLADLGSGSGVAAFAALVMNPELHAMLIDADPGMAAMARKSLTLPANAGISARAHVIEADVTKTGDRRRLAGLPDNSFDFVITNPPYNDRDFRVPRNTARAFAHMVGESGLESWIRTASAILRPGGSVYLIYRAQYLATVLTVLQGRFGAICVLPLHSRANQSASRVIVRARRGSRAPLAIHPGIVLHEKGGEATRIAQDAVNGRVRLFPD